MGRRWPLSCQLGSEVWGTIGLVGSDLPYESGLMDTIAAKVAGDLVPGRTCGGCSVCCEFSL
jgi:hypothetical protein